jgi:negative regulator of flagellin synthesis FlgM
MRIGSVNRVSQVYQTQTNTRKKDVFTTADRETYAVSSFGKDYQTAKNALAEVSDVREDKVSSLKQQINAGTYEVSNEDFAAHLMAAFQNRTL